MKKNRFLISKTDFFVTLCESKHYSYEKNIIIHR